jgi:MFS transporter, DHA1 family, inner membrane transport protein
MNSIGTSTDAAADHNAWVDPRLVVLACGMFAIGTDSFVIAGILPRIAQDLDVGAGMAGQLITAYALSYALITPIAAALTSSLARHRVLLAGLLVFVLGNLATAFAPDIVWALLGRAISGFGAALFAPAASAAAVALTDPGRRGHALAYMMVGLSSATALGAPIGTALSEFFDWRTIIMLIACLGVLVAIGVAASVGKMAAPKRIAMRDRIKPLGDAQVTGALLATFLVLAGLYTVYSYISVVFHPATRGDGTALAMLLSIWGLGAVAGSLAAGRLTDTYGSRAIVNVTLICLVIDIAALHWTSTVFAASAISVLIWGLCGWGFAIPQQHRLTSVMPDHSQITLGFYATAVYLGAAASGVIGAAALRFLDASSLPLVGAALIVAGLVVSEMTGYRSNEKSARP